MPTKKKGLGRDVNRSMEILQEAVKALGKVGNDDFPLKKGLVANHIDDADLLKMVDKIQVDATALAAALVNVADKVSAIKANRSSRFSDRAASSVVARFLSDGV